MMTTNAILATIADAGFALTIQLDERRCTVVARDVDGESWLVKAENLDVAAVEMAAQLGFDLEE